MFCFFFSHEFFSRFARTKEATEAGRFKAEVAPIVIKSKKGDTTVVEDEGFRKLQADKVPSLPPAFVKGGSVTAANSSSINDGASALVLASRAHVEQHGKGGLFGVSLFLLSSVLQGCVRWRA